MPTGDSDRTNGRNNRFCCSVQWHMLGQHSHPVDSMEASTHGRLIRWARFYDPCVTLLTLGRAPAMREEAADRAAIRPGESVLEHVLLVGGSTWEQRLAQPTTAVFRFEDGSARFTVRRNCSAVTGIGTPIDGGVGTCGSSIWGEQAISDSIPKSADLASYRHGVNTHE